MQTIPIAGEMQAKVRTALGGSRLFKGLDEAQLEEVARQAELRQYEPGETMLVEGEAADGFLMLLGGETAVSLRHQGSGREVEIGRLGAGEVVGEVALLLGQPRGATVVAVDRVHALAFPTRFFQGMIQRVPVFGLVLAQSLARHLSRLGRLVPVPEVDAAEPAPEVLTLLPMEFIERHRVLPLTSEGKVLTVGFVGDPSAETMERARQFVPGMELRAVTIPAAFLDRVLRAHAGAEIVGAPEVAPGATSLPLDRLLKAVVTEGASDLHLSAGQRPHWRIDGEVFELTDLPVLGPETVLELLGEALPERNQRQFAETNDTDFAYSLGELARFRVNIFRDAGGVGAVLRQIPMKILTFEQLGLPEVVARFCAEPKGLVLVTGPTGSGKSTTLAAMVDAINRSRREHLITLEDPIEFVHRSRQALVNQREVGPHTGSFARALRAALREDPDIVLVGEMRDLETVSLALETANTGHLVFGTLHTSTAISTVDRVVGMFPSDEQNQIRAVLADVLKGVLSQVLLKRIGGGRVAALEVLVVNHAVANLIREGKAFQIASTMQTGKAQGNQMLNDALARLVLDGTVDYQEARAKAVDKDDLERRLKMRPPAPV